MLGLFTNFGGVVGGTKDQLWSTVVSRANVRYVWLVFDQDFGATEIAKLEDTCAWVQE